MRLPDEALIDRREAMRILGVKKTKFGDLVNSGHVPKGVALTPQHHRWRYGDICAAARRIYVDPPESVPKKSKRKEATRA